MNNNITINIDWEYNAHVFWQNLMELFPHIAEQLTTGPTHVDRRTWDAIRNIDGFFGGPSHAPTALLEII